MKKIRAIIINPTKGTIHEEMIVPSLPEFYRIMECEYIEMFSSAPILRDTGHFLYADEDGLRKDNTHFFYLAGAVDAIRGTAIIMKSDAPNEVSCTLTVKQVKDATSFLTPAELITAYKLGGKI